MLALEPGLKYKLLSSHLKGNKGYLTIENYQKKILKAAKLFMDKKNAQMTIVFCDDKGFLGLFKEFYTIMIVRLN